jgi:CRISPR-associated protein Csh1
MVKEIINFTKNLDEGFKNLGVKPREGLHIMLKMRKDDGHLSISNEDYQYAIFSKKMEEESSLLEYCKFLSQNAWCIDTNKCFDLPTKAIHSCSPYLVAFKREHLEGGEKYKKNQAEKKAQVHQRFGTYFSKTNSLLKSEEEKLTNQVFELFFSQGRFLEVLAEITEKNKSETEQLTAILNELAQKAKDTKDKDEKETLKKEMSDIETQLLEVRSLDDGDYVLFYLDKSLDEYKVVHQKYLADRLFNTEKYNTPPNEEGHVFGTSNFMNGFNSSMPFLTHQTASFEITGRISDEDAKYLYEFQQILPRKTLPNPLPLFIFKDELQKNLISLFRESGYKLGYKELIESLWEQYQQDFGNYYLLTWQNTKDGIVFQDFDFVSQFEYEFDAQIENLFEIQEKGGKGTSFIHYPKITNVFQLEQAVFKSLIQSKYLKVDYFGELKRDDYEGLAYTFQSFSKYRKAVYDFVYKSKRQSIDEHIFYDMVFSHIKDDLRQNNGYSIKEKLNIWFSLYEKFNIHNKNIKISMANQLKNYQAFVAQLSMDKIDTDNATDKEFAFAAGQVIDYVLGKSQAQDKSYQLLEPYLQQAKCQEFKRAIANDIARYKHAINDSETRFKSVCDFVLTYNTDVNMKELMPEILAGAFSKCQFFHKDENKTQEK